MGQQILSICLIYLSQINFKNLNLAVYLVTVFCLSDFIKTNTYNFLFVELTKI